MKVAISKLLERFKICEAPDGATQLKIVNGTIQQMRYEPVLIRLEERAASK